MKKEENKEYFLLFQYRRKNIVSKQSAENEKNSFSKNTGYFAQDHCLDRLECSKRRKWCKIRSERQETDKMSGKEGCEGNNECCLKVVRRFNYAKWYKPSYTPSIYWTSVAPFATLALYPVF